ncbi:putative mitochondrial associated ribonuclease [Leptomonas seymouri]|uniref:Putative mitochondrial associated ribonuclease n=1 Tax=Leptomonas seymouri TaxID=5684 RepID=A0A0N1IAK4_LEPSE|nr:putative mitochondrial associated ribonuclease [Leptomonas seymouri]|eukprot:KPI90644.1 putative mitochondrial associated ribonuclease [Leptomonas seymouri]
MPAPTFIAPRSHLLQKYTSCRTLFMCCDIQEKLRSKIGNFSDAVVISNGMAVLHTVLTPQFSTFVATEHAPEITGTIAKDIQLPEGTPLFVKQQPSMLVSEMLPYLEGNPEKGLLPVQQAVLWGHESHVCILQTADELLQRNIRVAVLADGCAAQKDIDHQTAMQAMASWDGLTLTTFVSVMLQLTHNDPALMKVVWKLMKGKRTPNA